MKLFYHNDLDGRCAGFLVANHYEYEEHFEKGVNAFEVDYVRPINLDTIDPGETVFFVDYSFKDDTKYVLDELVERGCRVVWCDHHTSSLNLCKKHPELNEIEGIRAEGISGAALTYMYLYEENDLEELPYFIRLVSDYDCWIYKYGKETDYFKLGIDSLYSDALDCDEHSTIWSNLLYNRPVETNLSEEEIDIDSMTYVLNRGMAIETYVTNNNTFYRENFAYESEILGHKCLVVNQKTNSKIFGDEYDKYPLVAVWVYNGEKYVYSIFSSNKEIDCSKIAEHFGGGGHKGAAGFTTNELILK